MPFADSPASALVVPTTRRRDLREQERAAARTTRTTPGRAPLGSAVGSVRSGFRRLAAKALTVAAMAFAALLTVGVSIPASALGDPAAVSASHAAAAAGHAQIVTVGEDTAASVGGSRDAYQTTTAAQFAAAKAAAAKKASASAPVSFSINPNGTGPIRWPFAVTPKLGPGFGAPATCSGCQAVHQGQDFLMPQGTPLYAMADGVVVEHNESGSFGNHLVIRHEIDGQTVESLYAHMISGSCPLSVGDPCSARHAGRHGHDTDIWATMFEKFEFSIRFYPNSPITV